MTCALPASAAALGFVQAPGSPYGYGSEDSSDIATGDLNGDGREDVVSVNWGPLFADAPAYSVMLANPTGSLSPAPGGAVALESEPYRVVLGSFDSDGNLDMAISMGSRVDVYLGAGDGTFGAEPVTSLATGPGAIGLAASDLNGDTREDIVVANYESGTVSVFLAFGGSGSFVEYGGGPIWVGATKPIAVALADLNGDGLGDIVTANEDGAGAGEHAISVLLAGEGGVYDSFMRLPGEYVSQDIAIGHVDAGPTLDLVTVSSPNNGVVVKLGNGDGTFEDAPGGSFSFPSRLTSSLALADLDGDGRDDVSLPIGISISGVADHTVWVFGSAADGSLSPAEGSPLSVWPASFPDQIAAGDFNGDGTPDLLTANFTGNLTVLLRDDTPQPYPVMEPDSLNFGEEHLGQTSPPQEVQIVNRGSGTLDLSTLSVSGHSGQFSVDLSECPAELEQEEECAAFVRFAPTSNGEKTAGLHIPRALGPPAEVWLWGLAQDEPGAEMSPTAHDFGNLPVGDGPAGLTTFVVENTSTVPLWIGSVSLGGTAPGDFEIEYDGCENRWLDGEGDICEIDVSFYPRSVGAKTAILAVESPQLDSGLIAMLLGSGDPNPALWVWPESWDAGSVELGSDVTERFEVISGGETPLVIGTAGLTGTDAGEFTIVEDDCSGETLDPFEECALEVRFAPGSVGAKTATLEIPSNVAGGPTQIALEGSGQDVPAGTVTPASHDFGSVPVDTSSAVQTFTLESTGAETLTVSGVGLAAMGPGFQVVRNTCIAAELELGESCEVDVRFTPPDTGHNEGTLTFHTNAPEPQPAASLTGSGAENPGISVTPASHDFGSILVGGKPSAVAPFVVENTGTTLLTFTAALDGADAAEFTLDDSDCTPGALEPGETCVLKATFDPTSAGAKAAELQVSSNAGEQGRALSGFAATRTLEVTPHTAVLGDVPVGEESGPVQVTILNTGNSAVQVQSFGFTSGNTSQFTVVKDCLGELGPAELCAAEVMVHPTEAGEIEATLRVTANSTNGPWDIPFTATAVATPGISLTPTSHDFGSRIVDSGPGPSQTFTVESTGSADLDLGAIQIAGLDASQFGLVEDCPATLAPEGTCEIDVDFDPTSAGTKSAQLSVASDAAGSPTTAELSATGVARVEELEFGPAGHDFGEVSVGSQSPAETFTLESTGNVPAAVGSLSIAGAAAADFAIVENECAGEVLDPEQACDIEVRFAPSAIGARAAELQMTYAGAASPASAALSGTGMPNPAATLSPSSLEFGSRTVGEGPSTPQSVSILSTGTTPFEIDSVVLAGAAPGQFQLAGDDCIGPLPPGEDCEISVAFAPSAAGAQQAQIEIGTPGESSIFVVPLTGTGLARPEPPAPPAPAPPAPPPPPTCVTPEVKQPSVFVPKVREEPEAPGVRARFVVGGPVVLEVSGKLRFRVNGKARTAALGTRTLQPGGRHANYKAALPARLRKKLPIGSPVKLELRYRSRGAESACTSFGPVKRKNLTTKVVWIKAS